MSLTPADLDEFRIRVGHATGLAATEAATEAAREVGGTIADALERRFNQALGAQKVAGQPGYQELLRGDTPAAGASYRYRVPGNLVLYPLSVMCRLATSAAVGERTLTLEYQDDASVRYLSAGAPVTLAAGQVQGFCWHPKAGGVAWPVEDVAIAPLPSQFLYPSSQLVIKLGSGDVADQLDLIRVNCFRFPTDGQLPVPQLTV